jgi:hypothetical protein
MLAGCATDDVPLPPQPTRGNATVRATIYVEAAPNVAAQSKLASERAAATVPKTAAARNKQDKRATSQAARNKGTTTPVATAPPASPSADTRGHVIAQHVPLNATGFRYTYTVELDSGGTQTFGFASDQGLTIGDRVLMNDAGLVSVPK